MAGPSGVLPGARSARGTGMHKLILFACVAALSAAMPARAHPGGLDREGCHTNRKTGEYHCHRATAVPQPSRPPGRQADRPPADRMAAAREPSRSGNAHVFANCAEARAAGAAPVRRGEPGYGPHLDRDNDGIGCEPYRGR